jgi:hypothetical protein
MLAAGRSRAPHFAGPPRPCLHRVRLLFRLAVLPCLSPKQLQEKSFLVMSGFDLC